jgi:hypothetical protein
LIEEKGKEERGSDGRKVGNREKSRKKWRGENSEEKGGCRLDMYIERNRLKRKPGKSIRT